MRGVWKGAAAAAAAKGSGDSRGQQGTAGGSRRHGLKAMWRRAMWRRARRFCNCVLLAYWEKRERGLCSLGP